AEVIDAVVREEALVFRGEDCAPDDSGNVVVVRDVPIFLGHLDERRVVGVVHTTDGGDLEPGERAQIEYIQTIDVDIKPRAYRQPQNAANGSCGEHGAQQHETASTPVPPT